ncbi:MAG: DUF1254 domain-containing protein [Planctomycetota bacterium]
MAMKYTITCCVVLLGSVAMAQDWKTDIPKEITTPDHIQSKIGDLDYKDGYPTQETANKVRDELDYIHGVNAFMNSIQGVSVYALRKGLADVGIKDGEFFYTSKMLDSKSLLLTANADTVYFWGNLDLSAGPLVVETPPMVLGIFDDFWFRWVGDFGLAGPDKGKGGTFLLVGPGYEGTLPEGGYFVRRSRTNHVTMLFRAFLEDNDPAPPIARVKETLKIYPYQAGGFGNSVGSYLAGDAPLNIEPPKRTTPRLVEGSGLVVNTVPPNDFGHYEMLNELVQMEPAEALDTELAGQFAAIGIEKGKEFAPDARMRKILEKAVAVGNAASRSLGMGADPAKDFRFYGRESAWWNMLWEGGYEFLNPPPMITKEGVKPFPNSGARKLNARTSFFYTATGTTPAMCMRLEGIGSQYLVANVDKNGEPFDGSKTYKVVLPKDIPAARFWSFTVYDNQTRSMLQTPQLYPRAGSQSYPSPAAVHDSDGSTTIYFSPKQPQGVERGNWVQTNPDKGWFTILRLYSPLQSFFDKTWRPSEIELAK